MGIYVYELAWDGTSKSASIIRKVLIGDDEGVGPLERHGLGHRDPSGKLLYVSYLDTRFCQPAANQSVYVKPNGQEGTRVLGPNKVYGGFAYVGKKVYVLEACSNQIKEIIDNNVSGRVVFDFGNFEYAQLWYKIKNL